MATEIIDILILGSGGREHALLAKIAESPRACRLYVSPGNGGMARFANVADIDIENGVAVANWAAEHNIGLVVIEIVAQTVERVTDAVEILARGAVTGK